MKKIVQEQGTVILVVLSVISLIGIIVSITAGDNPLKENIYNLLHSIPSPEELLLTERKKLWTIKI